VHPFAPIALLAQAAAKRGLLGRALGLWIGLAVLGIVLILLVWALGSNSYRGRLRALGVGRARRRRAIKDAWAEAGKRAEPLPLDDMPETDPGEAEPGP
jgi:hypothetical protein